MEIGKPRIRGQDHPENSGIIRQRGRQFFAHGPLRLERLRALISFPNWFTMALPESPLLDLLKFDEAEGTIRWKHRRMLLFDADAMGLLRRELVDALGLAAARRILTRFGYACGYRDALTSKELLPWKHQEELWELGPWLHAQEGIAHCRTLHSRIDAANNIFEVEGEWANSYEAQQHRQHIEPISDYPVCWTLTGYASGHSSAYSVARSSTTKKNAWERETSAVLSLATLQMTKPRKSEISRRSTKWRTLRSSYHTS